MKLDRNITDDGLGKYALLNLRKLQQCGNHGVEDALALLESLGVLEWGREGSKEEFFVIKLRDMNAPTALYAYAASAALHDIEFADEVAALAERAKLHPGRKEPD